jgi:hypothetical protein
MRRPDKKRYQAWQIIRGPNPKTLMGHELVICKEDGNIPGFV